MRLRTRLRNVPFFLALFSLAPVAWAESEKPAQSGQESTSASDTATDRKSADTTNESPQAEGQEKEQASPPASSTEPEASAPRVSKVDPYAEAKERVARAERLYEDGNYDAALTEFERAYETMLGHPARSYVLFNIGKCQEKLYRYAQAIASYKLYLELSGKKAEDRPTVSAKIDLLEGLLGTLKLSVIASKGELPAHYEVWVDGRLIEGKSSELLIPGGNHQVEVRAEGFEVENQEVQLPARSEKSLHFSLTPLAKEYKGISSSYFWTAGGLAAATGITGGVFGMMTLSKRSELDGKDPASITQDEVDSLKKTAMIADIFFVSAGVFATSAVILGFLTDWSDEPLSDESSPVSVKKIGFATSPEGAFFNLQGSF